MYTLLEAHMDESLIRNYREGQSGSINDVFKNYTYLLSNTIVYKEDFSMMIFAVDVFVTRPELGDSCAQQRERK
jgi:hypothetical protein